MYAFRFDDAKYIETSSDEYYGSDFWENVIGTAKSYALSTKDISLYCYGEILNTAGNGRNYSAYTQKMSVTDNITSDNITSSIANGNAAGAAVTYADTGVEPEKLVLWAESHDTYMGSTEIAIIYGQPEENVRTESTKEIITSETKETTKSVETVETTQDTSTEPKETTTVQNTQASPGMVKIYFTNNKVWGKVNVYYWGSSKSIST